ncbi:acetyltransferase, GNAT family protein [Besnoitia besnoiti]|uniref:peptidyl-tRNA hydrolase n=1 Tax=Besnoitia besnoiti TaxID=94643 RepID=A0A2A9MHS2_BESBE|nr:acetyltransferase, GNAT family protein [Besnoitia besnoiti]PFH37535.1 acetyltransferase, GNAT family protein [Besnoitia besnoiti]
MWRSRSYVVFLGCCEKQHLKANGRGRVGFSLVAPVRRVLSFSAAPLATCPSRSRSPISGISGGPSPRDSPSKVYECVRSVCALPPAILSMEASERNAADSPSGAASAAPAANGQTGNAAKNTLAAGSVDEQAKCGGKKEEKKKSFRPDPLVQYVVVRKDLQTQLAWPTGAVIAQACHACISIVGSTFSDPTVQAYLEEGDSMREVVLEVSSEEELRKIAEALASKDILHKLWIEQPEGIPTCVAWYSSAANCAHLLYTFIGISGATPMRPDTSEAATVCADGVEAFDGGSSHMPVNGWKDMCGNRFYTDEHCSSKLRYYMLCASKHDDKNEYKSEYHVCNYWSPKISWQFFSLRVLLDAPVSVVGGVPTSESRLDFSGNSQESSADALPKKSSPLQSSAVASIQSRAAGRREALERLVDFGDFLDDDAEEVRLLLLKTKEYPVKYSSATMRHFLRKPLFRQLSVVAREKTAETGRKKRRIVGVAGTAVDDRGMANIMMLAIDTTHRRLGLGRELLRRSLEKASLFAPGSTQNPNPHYKIARASLHVWISQAPPLSLYLSTGFTPVRYIPDYYTSVDVEGGYEMQLSLPYMPVEERLQAAVNKQARVIQFLESKLERLSHGPPGSGAAKVLEALPPVRALPMRDASHETETRVLAFLASLDDEHLLQSAQEAFADPRLRKLAFFAIGPSSGDVLGALWLGVPPQHGVITHVEVTTDEAAEPETLLYLYEALLVEAANPEHGQIEKVVDRVPADNIFALTQHWELGFRVSNFFEVTSEHEEDKSGEDAGDLQSFNWDRGRRFFEHEMTATIPWRKPEELALLQVVQLNKSRVALLKETLKVLEKHPPPPPSLAELSPPAEGQDAQSVALPDGKEKTLEGAEPHKRAPTPAPAAGRDREETERSVAAPLPAARESIHAQPEASPASQALPAGVHAAASSAPIHRRKEGGGDAQRGAGANGPASGRDAGEGSTDEKSAEEGVVNFLQQHASVFLLFTVLIFALLCYRRFCRPEVAPALGSRRHSEGAAGDLEDAESGGRGGRGKETIPGAAAGGVGAGDSSSGKRPHAKKEGYAPVALPIACQEQFSDDEDRQ